MDKIQQTIVIRTHYPDGNGGLKKLRTGKYCAQASHASMAFMSHKWRNAKQGKFTYLNSSSVFISEMVKMPESLTQEEQTWIDESFTKVCLCVKTEEELLAVYQSALDAGLNVHLIQDNGDTEFHGVKTYTCLAIGPHSKSKIDPITKDLSLF